MRKGRPLRNWSMPAKFCNLLASIFAEIEIPQHKLFRIEARKQEKWKR